MGNSELPTARAAPRNLAERVESARGSLANAKQRAVARYTTPVPSGEAAMLIVLTSVVGCVLATLHHLHIF